jgi:TRAP-type uncharacterized transport system substrate-binding protein
LGVAVTVSLAQEEPAARRADVVVSSGVEGGGYWSAGARLQDVAAEMDLEVANRSSSGSLENLERLLDSNSPVNVAFAQADALQHYVNHHPGEERKLDILESIGQECVFIVVGANSDIRNGKDLQEAGELRLGIASASSGIAVTFGYMASHLPDLADIEVVYGDTRSAMEHLDSGGASVDAIMMVHRPRELSPEVDMALSHPGRFNFFEQDGEGLDVVLAKEREVYSSNKKAMPRAE